ncbi:MAG: hypothetical protein AAB923_02130 [Patescibacteria group bacterium]
MEAFIIEYFFTEHPNCELASFGIQWLNLLSNLVFFIVAYLLYRLGGRARWIGLLVLVSGIGSYVHHIWPADWSIPFDMFPAVIVGAVALGLSYKNLTRDDWLLFLGIGTIALLTLLLDDDLCQFVPFGLHFIWHVSAATILYLFGRRI